MVDDPNDDPPRSVEEDVKLFKHCAKVSGDICESLKQTSANFQVMSDTVDRTNSLLDAWLQLCQEADGHMKVANDFVYNEPADVQDSMPMPAPMKKIATSRYL